MIAQRGVRVRVSRKYCGHVEVKILAIICFYPKAHGLAALTCFLITTSASFADKMPRPAAIFATAPARQAGVIDGTSFGPLLLRSSLKICLTIVSRVSKTRRAVRRPCWHRTQVGATNRNRPIIHNPPPSPAAEFSGTNHTVAQG